MTNWPEGPATPGSERSFLQEHGYLVARGLVPADVCTRAKEAFLSEIKPSDDAFMRQTTTRAERHNLSEYGLMTNPMLDVHNIQTHLPFTEAVLGVFTHQSLQATLNELLGDQPVMVQSMYFESSRGTDAHMDSHFMDTEERGALLGAWIALEDIDVLGGRFCVYPKSNRLLEDGAFEPQITQLARAYEDQSVSVIQGYQLHGKSFSLKEVTKTRKYLMSLIRASGVEPYAPALNCGDVVFFSSRTLHGSLKPGSSELTPGLLGQGAGSYSRHSLTCHWIPKNQGLVFYHAIRDPLQLVSRHGTLFRQSP
ncbi:MAG: phytanoyl-CoA dioxygenase family protein [Acidobacteria bacterium]|nr:phytanoyl-CoA dioxygenase family protein [Acidobacteriota bacterium]